MLKKTALAGGVALTVLAWSAGAFAATPEEEEARIARLEAAVAALQAQVQADSQTAAENAALKAQVGSLEAKVATLEAAPPAEGAGSVAFPKPPASANAPVVTSTFANGEPGIATADGKFSLNVYALVQLDTALYDQSQAGPLATDLRRDGPALGYSSSNVDNLHARNLKNGDDFRRARFGFSGNALDDFQYRVVFDFGGSGVENAGQLYEAWAQYSGFHPFKIRVGAFAPLQGLSDQDSTAAQPLLERPASSDIARGFAAGDTRTAAQIFGYGDHWLASYAVTGRIIGVDSSAGTGVAQSYSDQLGMVARLAGTPFYGDDWRIHLGAHAQYIVTPPNTTGPSVANATTPLTGYTISLSDQPELRVDGTKLINTGNIDARHGENEGAEFAAQWKSFLLQSEYDHFDIQRTDLHTSNPHFAGYYFEGSWLVTGAARKYNTATAAFDAPPVLKSIGGGGIGEVELTVRYTDMNLNYDAGQPGTAPSTSAIRGGDQHILTGGVNWYLNPYVRVAFEAQHVVIKRLSPDTIANNVNGYDVPIGARIGQSYNAFAVRTQVGF